MCSYVSCLCGFRAAQAGNDALTVAGYFLFGAFCFAMVSLMLLGGELIVVASSRCKTMIPRGHVALLGPFLGMSAKSILVQARPSAVAPTEKGDRVRLSGCIETRAIVSPLDHFGVTKSLAVNQGGAPTGLGDLVRIPPDVSNPVLLIFSFSQDAAVKVKVRFQIATSLWDARKRYREDIPSSLKVIDGDDILGAKTRP